MAKAKNANVMGLDERALLVKLSIGAWSGRVTDKEVSRKVAADHEATNDAGYFRKQLFGKEALNEIQKLAGAARTAHYSLTLPWTDDGSRIITTESYDHYTKVMRDYRRKIKDAVEEFLDKYDEHVKQSKKRLGKLFKAEDYPPRDVVRSKFTFDVEPMPVPTARDFRAKVSDAEANAIAKDIERRTQERLEQAMRDVYERIAEVTGKMVEKLDSYKPREGLRSAEGLFRDSLVGNIRKLAETLPYLNITKDPALDKLQKELLDNLCAYEPDDLRTDAKARALTAKKAKAIHDKVSAFLG